MNCYNIQSCTVFQNAAVGMPILSTSKMADEDSILVFHKKGGFVYHLPSQTMTPFIKRLGVYVIQLRVPKEIDSPDFGRQQP